MIRLGFSALVLLIAATEASAPKALDVTSIQHDGAIERPCTPLIRGVRILACARPSRPRLDSGPGGVLTSRPPRPERAPSVRSADSDEPRAFSPRTR